MRYQIMIGDFDGFIKVTQFIQPFNGSLVTDPESFGTDTVEGFMGDQEVLTIVVEIPTETVPFFEKLCETIGLLDGVQMKRFELEPA